VVYISSCSKYFLVIIIVLCDVFVSVQLLMSKHLSTTIKTASPVALLGDASSSTDGSRKVMEEGRASGLMVECGKEKKKRTGSVHILQRASIAGHKILIILHYQDFMQT